MKDKKVTNAAVTGNPEPLPDASDPEGSSLDQVADSGSGFAYGTAGYGDADVLPDETIIGYRVEDIDRV